MPLVQRFRKAAEAWIRHWKCGGLVDRERDEASTSKEVVQVVDRWRDGGGIQALWGFMGRGGVVGGSGELVANNEGV